MTDHLNTLQTLVYQLGCGITNIEAVTECLENGAHCHTEYIPAMKAASTYLMFIYAQLKQVQEAMAQAPPNGAKKEGSGIYH